MMMIDNDDDGDNDDDDDDNGDGDNDVSSDRIKLLPRILKKHNIYFGKFTIFRKMSRTQTVNFRIC